MAAAQGKRRLVILACSARKRSGAAVPAIELYDGPRFQLLRKYIRDTGDQQLRVAVLSAEHGLIIDGNRPIHSYDRRMDVTRARELRPAVMTKLKLVAANSSEVFILVNSTYSEALSGWRSVLTEQRVRVATGGQGTRLGQLRRWLYRLRNVKPVKRPVSATGVARIGGVSVQKTPEEVQEFARREFPRASREARRFREWYVEIDGVQMSPKWLVSALSGVPVQRFQAGEARRVLAQLGIETKPVRREKSA